jgi:hypothetical protein
MTAVKNATSHTLLRRDERNFRVLSRPVTYTPYPYEKQGPDKEVHQL